MNGEFPYSSILVRRVTEQDGTKAGIIALFDFESHGIHLTTKI